MNTMKTTHSPFTERLARAALLAASGAALLLMSSSASANNDAIAPIPPIPPIAPIAPMPAPNPAPPPPPAPPGSPLAPLPPLPPFHSGNPGPKDLAVSGPITLHVNVVSTDIEVVGTSANRVHVTMSGSRSEVQLAAHGDRVDVLFPGGHEGWGAAGGGIDGHAKVEVPAGSAIEISTISGDLHCINVGKVRARSASGDLTVRGAAGVEAQLVSGDVVLDDIRGDVRLRTVSGDVHVKQTGGPASVVEFGTTSGDLAWLGQCGSGCRIEARTMSGDVHLQLSGAPSLEAAFATHSGDFTNRLGGQVLAEDEDNHRVHVGKGEGLIEVQTFSGDLALTK